MDETPEKAGNYAHAYYRNPQFTRVMLGMGVFEQGSQFNDDITLREEVQRFYELHHNELYAAVDATAAVPYVEGSYAESCREGHLAVKVAPRMAAVGMLSCGIVGEFEKMRSVHQAYRSAITTFDHRRQTQAHVIMHETLSQATVQRSELYRDIPGDNEVKVHYAQTLRRCMAWSAISSDVYETRMKQANLRPVPIFVRRLSHIFYSE
jgi:hypothetical protein